MIRPGPAAAPRAAHGSFAGPARTVFVRLGHVQPAADTAGSVGAGAGPEHRAREATVPLRPLSFRELLDLPFALIQADIRALAGTAGLLVFAGGSAVAAFTGLVSHLTDGSDTGTALAALSATLACAWLIRLALRGITVAIGLARAGRTPIGLRVAARRTGTRLAPLALTQLSFTALGAGVLLLSGVLFPVNFAGGLAWFLFSYPFCLLWLAGLRASRSAAVPVLFAEGAGAQAAFARSGLLTGDLRWRRAGLWICQRLLFALLTAPLAGSVLFLSDITGTHRWATLVLLTATALLLVAFVEVVESAARVVGYLDLRCRREGADIRIPAGGPR